MFVALGASPASARVTCGGFDENNKWLGDCATTAAKFVKKIPACPQGTFFDPIDTGSCWSCPSGYNRHITHVKAQDACIKAPSTEVHRAKMMYPAGCKAYGKDSFYDPRNGGECWSCPSGYWRSVYPVNEGWACGKDGQPWARATYNGRKKDCLSGTFFDPIDGGTC